MFEFPKDEIRELFQNSILSWFALNGRSFPWRNNRDPYSVLLIEKLLQQTSVKESVITIYTELIKKYPSPIDLAKADVVSLRRLILPLGLHYRANDLVLLAKDIEERFEGNVPATLKELLSIYGVGDYSARAVLSFAFEKDTPVVDTNVARILFRVFGINSKFPSNPARNKYLIDLASYLLPAGKSKEFNWGVIDLGALVCKPYKPNCPNCPLKHICIYANNVSSQ